MIRFLFLNSPGLQPGVRFAINKKEGLCPDKGRDMRVNSRGNVAVDDGSGGRWPVPTFCDVGYTNVIGYADLLRSGPSLRSPKNLDLL